MSRSTYIAYSLTAGTWTFKRQNHWSTECNLWFAFSTWPKLFWSQSLVYAAILYKNTNNTKGRLFTIVMTQKRPRTPPISVCFKDIPLGDRWDYIILYLRQFGSGTFLFLTKDFSDLALSLYYFTNFKTLAF